MEANIANLSLEGEEEESIPCEREPKNDDEDRRFCLVGRALIDCVIHFPSLKRTITDLWHPLGGASINFPPSEYRGRSKVDTIVLFLFSNPSSQSTICSNIRRFSKKIGGVITPLEWN
ncbi:hypothetical protein Golob_022981 [Gossypium lobatum]|uniref:DUF4283 domain-containing protein n=1 Tax=Gossypium lobatum TaxID=34289 RepID=A0A7J8LI95_9ROSI|nr:hypothetical protein [Gossypium lobatum]